MPDAAPACPKARRRRALGACLVCTAVGASSAALAVDRSPAPPTDTTRRPDDTATTAVGSSPTDADAVAAGAEKGPNTLETVKAIAAHEVIEQKKRAAVVKDSVIYDEMDSYGDETLAESLMAAPGISAVEDAGEPRFVTIRGIQPNLNFTSLDGIAIASVGNSGSGERMNNLQLIPSDIGTRTDIYKTFGAQQAPDAIGGIIDIVSRSAFDRAGRYVFADAAGI